MPSCPSCGASNTEEARFCSACGTQLIAAELEREVRKTVTIVFCDVAGSTSLGERRDPEAVRGVMSRYFDFMRSTLERHGGTVEKFIGDAVVGAFGVPNVHEDDALRAVRAAVEMRDGLRELNDRLEREWGAQLAVRIGVNTGEVVAGDTSTGQGFLTGDAVNVAARFEQAAASGEILIGERTFRLVRDTTDLEDVPPLALKGKAETVPAHRVVGVRRLDEERAARTAAPLVGRTVERHHLLEVFGRASDGAGAQLVTVLGMPGVGKSRLVAEFCSDVEDRSTILRGHCLSYGNGITYWPIAEIVSRAAGISDTDGSDDIRKKLVSLVTGQPDRELIVTRIATLVGLAGSDASPDETAWAIRRLLETIAMHRPLVVVIDDIHWAEPTLLDLIESIRDQTKEGRVIVVCMSRPELLETRPAWGESEESVTLINLDSLSPDESELLIGGLLGKVDDRVRHRVVEACGGNPLFVEETISMLVDEGMLRRDDDAWKPTDTFSGVSVPPTISSLLAARLERLPREERAVLECASVMGQVFNRADVEEMASVAVREHIAVHLVTLGSKNVVVPEPSMVEGEQMYRFRHILIRDAAYESLPKQVRADLHERFADVLEAKAGDRIAGYEEVVGYHLEQACRYQAELRAISLTEVGLAKKASSFLSEGGQRALLRGDVRAASSLLSRGCALLDESDPDRLRLLPSLGASLRESGDATRSREVLHEAVERAREAGMLDVEWRGRAELFEMAQGVNLVGTEAEARRVIPILEDMGDHLGVAKAWRVLSLVYWSRYEFGACREASLQAIDFSRKAGDRREEIEVVAGLAGIAHEGPTPSTEGLRLCQELLEDVSSNSRAEGFVLFHSAGLLSMAGRFAEADERLDRAEEILDNAGITRWRAGIADLRATNAHWAGYDAIAERVLRESHDWCIRFDRESTPFMGLTLFLFLCDQGRIDEAGRDFPVPADLDPEDLELQVLAKRAQARMALLNDDSEGAIASLREAALLLAQSDTLNVIAGVRLDLAKAFRHARKTEEASGAASTALDLYRRKENLPGAAAANRFLSAES